MLPISSEKPGMRKVYDLLYPEFAKLVVKPDLAMPWPAWYDLSGNLPQPWRYPFPPTSSPRNCRYIFRTSTAMRATIFP